MESYRSFLDRDTKYIKNILKLLYRFNRTPVIVVKKMTLRIMWEYLNYICNTVRYREF